MKRVNVISKRWMSTTVGAAFAIALFAALGACGSDDDATELPSPVGSGGGGAAPVQPVPGTSAGTQPLAAGAGAGATGGSSAAGTNAASGSAGRPAAVGGMSAPGVPTPSAGTGAAPTAGASGMPAPMAGAPATADSSAPDPSPGCAVGTIKAGHTMETIQVGNARREYVQTVPTSYDGKTPYSVLLDFHGGTYDGPRWDSRASNKFHDMAETERFIYITPTGLEQWWTTTDGAEGADGMFMRALLDKLKTSACVDNRRVYSTGCSMGGDMSFYMACYFSDVIAAALPLCGSASFDLDMECKPKRPVSVQFVIGSQDSLNCWEPPRTSVGNPCATEVQATFKRLNGCTGEPKKTQDGVCETLDQCNEGTEVTICNVNAQHTTIYTNPDIDIYTEGWAWLKRFYIH